jgi:RNA polymerase sigma factor (sigma-70 family)
VLTHDDLTKIAARQAARYAKVWEPRYEEFLGEARLALIQKLDDINDHPNPRALAARIARQKIQDILRHERVRQVDKNGTEVWHDRETAVSQISAADPETGEQLSTQDQIDLLQFDHDLYQSEQRLARLTAAMLDDLSRLPKSEQIVVEKRFGLNGNGGKMLSVREIARLTGNEPAKVRATHDLALRKLKNIPPRPFVRIPDSPYRVWP